MQALNRTRVFPAEHVLEVVTPRTNTARLSSAEHLFGTLVSRQDRAAEPVSLEIVADAEQRRFLVRTASPQALRRVAGQLGAAYPQAVLRSIESPKVPSGDPVHIGPDEQAAAATLKLRSGHHLPLRTFDDQELESAGVAAQSDPLLSILGALADLPTGWRAVCQLIVLAPAPHNWARDYLRLALEQPLVHERRADTGPSPMGPLALLGLIGLYTAGTSVSDAWSRGDWLPGLELVLAVLVLVAASIVVMRRLRRREMVDPHLVQAKLSRDACLVELRLAVIAPGLADADVVARSSGPPGSQLPALHPRDRQCPYPPSAA